MSERKRTLDDGDKLTPAVKRSLIEDSPSAAPISQESSTSTSLARPRTEEIKKSSTEVPERFLNSVSEKIHELQMETECNVYISPDITGLTRTVYLQGFKSDIQYAKDRIEELVMSSISFEPQVSRYEIYKKAHINMYSPRSPSPIRTSSNTQYSPCGAEEPEENEEEHISIEIPASETQCLLIIGKFGDTLRKLEKASDCAVYTHRERGVIQVTGDNKENVEKAQDKIIEMITSLKTPSPEARVSRDMSVPSVFHTKIRGSKRQTFEDICKEHDVQWRIKHIEGSRNEMPIRLTGKEEQVEMVMKEVMELMSELRQEEIIVHSAIVSKVTGANGVMLKLIQEESSALCVFDSETLDDPAEMQKILRIGGTASQVSAAKKMVLDLTDSNARVFLNIPFAVYDAVMGENYKNIKHISEVSGADCSNAIATERKKVIRIEGKAAQVEHAKALLQKLIEAEEAKNKNTDTLVSLTSLILPPPPPPPELPPINP